MPELSKPVVTFLTVMSALPLAGLFTDDWKAGGVLRQTTDLCPTISLA